MRAFLSAGGAKQKRAERGEHVVAGGEKSCEPSECENTAKTNTSVSRDLWRRRSSKIQGRFYILMASIPIRTQKQLMKLVTLHRCMENAGKHHVTDLGLDSAFSAAPWRTGKPFLVYLNRSPN